MFNFFNVPLIFFIYNIVTRRKEELPMRKKYVVILTGIIFSFVILSGCGMNRDVQRTQQPDDGSTQTEEELQAEIDALQQQIDELKNGQQDAGSAADDGNTADSSQTTDSTQASDNSTDQTGDSTNRSHHSSGNSAGASNVSITLEEAQNIALERVPGATVRNISIELERDDGWYIYEGDIEYDGMEYEFEIDADTGNILKWEEERW